MADTPHFAFPFRLADRPGGALAAAVNEQHSDEEVFDSLQLIASFPRGSRHELPTFGVSDQTASRQPLDYGLLERELEEWEPRASASVLVQVARGGSETTGGLLVREV